MFPLDLFLSSFKYPNCKLRISPRILDKSIIVADLSDPIFPHTKPGESSNTSVKIPFSRYLS